MMSIKLFVLCIGMVATSWNSVHCFDEETLGKIKSFLQPVVTECGSKLGITEEQLTEAHEKEDFSSIDSCLAACIFKHIGFINDKGVYDKDASIAEVKKHLSGDDLTNTIKIAEACSSVNDASVSDGDKGCDRAKLLFECIHQHNHYKAQQKAKV